MRARFDTADAVYINEIVYENRENGLHDIFSEVRGDPSFVNRMRDMEMLGMAWWIVQARGYEVQNWRVTKTVGVYRALGWNGTTELGSLIECDTTGNPVTADHMRDLRECLQDFPRSDTVTMISRTELPPSAIVSMSLRSPVELIGRQTLVKWATAALEDGCVKLSAAYINTLMKIGTVGLERQEFGRLLLPSDFGNPNFNEVATRLGLPSQYMAQLENVKFFPFEMMQEICREPELMHGLTPRLFEELIAEILVKLQFENIELTQYSRDGGRDIVAEKTVDGIPLRFFIECKKYSRENKIRVDTIRSLLGVTAHNDRYANVGVLVTTSRFTKGALELIASDARLDGKDFDGIATWLKSIN